MKNTLLFVLLFLATGCETQPQLSKSDLHISIERTTSILNTIAITQGYFKEQGLNITTTQYNYGLPTFKDLLAGKVDVAQVATFPVTYASFKSSDFRIVSTYVSMLNDFMMFARKDAGITTITDLKGKRIGIVKGSVSEYYLDVNLAYYKMFIEEVTPVFLKPEAIPDAITAGEIDAGIVWTPFHGLAKEQLGDNFTLVQGQQGYWVAINITVSKELLEKHPETMVRYFKALKKAESYLKTNRDQAVREHAEFVKMPYTILKHHYDYAQMELHLKQPLLNSLESEARWLVSHKYVPQKKIPNYLQLIDGTPLQQIFPERVKIITQ